MIRRATGRDIRATVATLANGSEVVPCCLCLRPLLITDPDTGQQRSGNLPTGPTIEHRRPLSKGGTNDLDNLALAHRMCNTSRGNRDPTDVGHQSRPWLAPGF